MTHASIARRTFALLFHVRAVVVCVALTVGLVLWLVAGILGGLFASVARALVPHRPSPRRAARESRESREMADFDAARAWSLPGWLKA